MLQDALLQIVKIFPPAIISRGHEYQRHGFVLNVRMSEGLIKARVKGKGGQIYDCYIDLHVWPKKPTHCTCGYAVNCKHAVAALLDLQAREEKQHNRESTTPTLNDTLTEWLKQFDYENHEEKKILSHCFLYFLDQSNDNIVVRLALAKRLKNGGVGKSQVLRTLSAKDKKFLDSEDEIITAALLFNQSYYFNFDYFSLKSDLLEKIIATGRAYWQQTSNPVLTMGALTDAHLGWKLDALKGRQYLTIETVESLHPFLLDKLWYWDPTQYQLGYLNVPYTFIQLKKLLTVPPVELHEIPLMIEAMTDKFPEFPRPRQFDRILSQTITPIPVLVLGAREEGENTYAFTQKVSFIYENQRIEAEHSSLSLFSEKGAQLIELNRDMVFEEKMLRYCDYYLPIETYSTSEDAQHIAQNIVPKLQTKGWEVEYTHPIFFPVIDAEEVEWFSTLDESDSSFFDYQLGILVNGEAVNIVSLMVHLISQFDHEMIDSLEDDKLIYLSLPNQQRLKIKLGRLKPLLQFLLQYRTKGHDASNLKLDRYQFILMAESERALAATSMRWQGGELIRKQLTQLITLQKPESLEAPKGLQTTLRDYQQQGLEWLQLLRTVQLGGVLADDMGLGKTIQTLAHLLYEKEHNRLKKPCLIIAPTSLVGNWFEEAQRFAPGLKMLIFHGASRHDERFDAYDVVISTYGLVQRDKSKFINHSFYYLILDEAQTIKNARAKTTLIIQQISAEHRLCLSGTPLENHLGELWSLFNFIMPGLLGDMKQFKRFFRIPIEKGGDKACQERLANRVRPFMLRRTKNQVVNELPDKTEIKQMIELSGTQRDLYEAIRLSMEKKVREAIVKLGMNKSQIILLDALLKLRQVCCDPRLLSIPEAQMAHGNSAKLEACMELIDGLVAENRRILVFSQFTSMLALIEECLVARHYPYLKLTGQTQKRQQLVNRFQEGDIPIFLISLKAGGTGLNLTQADTVIHYDPWWNPAVEEQATGRSHRIGQTNPVFVYKLITAGTVEEAILALQDKKRALFDGILSENLSQIKTMTENDLEQLFMPLS